MFSTYPVSDLFFSQEGCLWYSHSVCPGDPCDTTADEPLTVTTDVGREKRKKKKIVEEITPKMAMFSKCDCIMKPLTQLKW